MTPITYRPVSEVDFETFTAAFNRAYRDYYVHIFMTSDSFRALMQRDDLDPDASVVALNADQIVGTGLLGLRAHSGWIGGLGVIPPYRRQGIGRQMMRYLLDRARDHALKQVRLEVIETNTGAHALYRQLGFDDLRYLHYLERDPGPVPDPPTAYQIERRAPEEMLAYFDSFHEVETPWQRAYPSLVNLAAAHMRGWAALDAGTIVGYALGWTDYHLIRLSDLATRPGTNRGAVAHALLAHLHRIYLDAESLSINVAADDPALAGYQAAGYTTHLRQIEMGLTL